MEDTTLRSRMCQCGIKLLLKITKDDGKLSGVSLSFKDEDRESSTVEFINSVSKRSRRTLRSWSMTLGYVYCKKCTKRVQVRTFDTLEEYL